MIFRKATNFSSANYSELNPLPKTILGKGGLRRLSIFGAKIENIDSPIIKGRNFDSFQAESNYYSEVELSAKTSNRLDLQSASSQGSPSQITDTEIQKIIDEQVERQAEYVQKKFEEVFQELDERLSRLENS